MSEVFIKKNQSFGLFNTRFCKNQYFSVFFQGFYLVFRVSLSFLGLGYKRFIYTHSIILKLGFSHRIVYLTRSDLKVLLLKRRQIEILTRNLSLLNRFKNSLESMRSPNKYKRKGVYIRGTKILLRLSSKKAKF